MTYLAETAPNRLRHLLLILALIGALALPSLFALKTAAQQDIHFYSPPCTGSTAPC